MSFILSLINSPAILAVIAGIGAFIAAYIRGRSDGKTKERAKQLRQEAVNRRSNDAIIDKADLARRNAGADFELYDNDGFERPD